MNRETHKAKMKAILESITYDITPAITTNYTVSGVTNPFIFITSLGLAPDEGGQGEISYTDSYDRVYEYALNVIFQIGSGQNPIDDARIDEYEQLILDRLSKQDVRNDNASLYTGDNLPLASERRWNDLRIVEITSPIQAPLSLDDVDDYVIKSFIIEINQLETYVRN